MLPTCVGGHVRPSNASSVTCSVSRVGGGEDAERERRVGSAPAYLGRNLGVRNGQRTHRRQSVETFRSTERERVGKILQEMVREAEKWASTTSSRFPSGADPT